MSQSVLNLNYHGPKHGVRVFSDGQLVVHSSTPGTDSSVLVISIQCGTHELRTLATLQVEGLSGTCQITVGTHSPVDVKKGDRLTIQAGSVFTLTSKSAVLEVIPEQGPGFANPRDGGGTLP